MSFLEPVPAAAAPAAAPPPQPARGDTPIRYLAGSAFRGGTSPTHGSRARRTWRTTGMHIAFPAASYVLDGPRAPVRKAAGPGGGAVRGAERRGCSNKVQKL